MSQSYRAVTVIHKTRLQCWCVKYTVHYDNIILKNTITTTSIPGTHTHTHTHRLIPNIQVHTLMHFHIQFEISEEYILSCVCVCIVYISLPL